MRDLNPRPPRCGRGALPLRLTALVVPHALDLLIFFRSNQFGLTEQLRGEKGLDRRFQHTHIIVTQIVEHTTELNESDFAFSSRSLDRLVEAELQPLKVTVVVDIDGAIFFWHRQAVNRLARERVTFFLLIIHAHPEGFEPPNLLIRSQTLYPLSYGRLLMLAVYTLLWSSNRKLQ